MLFIFQPANFLAAPALDFFSKRLRLLVIFSSGSSSKEPKIPCSSAATGSGSDTGSPALVFFVSSCPYFFFSIELYHFLHACDTWPTPLIVCLFLQDSMSHLGEHGGGFSNPIKGKASNIKSSYSLTCFSKRSGWTFWVRYFSTSFLFDKSEIM